MKIKYILIVSLIFGVTQAQTETTGINTKNPLGTLHVDGMGDNSTNPSASQQLNDFIVKDNGNVGIGLVSPNYKLDIATGGTAQNPIKGIRINDGSQQDGFVLTSDENGIGDWQPIDISIYKEELSGVYSLESSEDKIFYTQKSITLPPGYWLITLSIGVYLYPFSTYQVGSNMISLRLMDSSNPSNLSSSVTNVSADAVMPFLASSRFLGSESRGMLYGSLAIKNTSSTPKTYYLFADQYGGDIYNKADLEFGWNETFMYYFRIAEPN